MKHDHNITYGVKMILCVSLTVLRFVCCAIGDNDIPIAVIDDVNKEVSSTTYKQQKLSPSYEALKRQGFKITNYEER